MTTTSQRVYNRNRRHIWNGKHIEKAVMIDDPQCGKPYFITKAEYGLYAKQYQKMGVRILVNGQEVIG